MVENEKLFESKIEGVPYLTCRRVAEITIQVTAIMIIGNGTGYRYPDDFVSYNPCMAALRTHVHYRSVRQFSLR